MNMEGTVDVLEQPEQQQIQHDSVNNRLNPRPASMSLITVTSLTEEEQKVYGNGNRSGSQVNSNKMNVSTVSNLTHYYINQAMDQLDEDNNRNNNNNNRPIIVIDHHESDHEHDNDVDVNAKVSGNKTGNITGNETVVETTFNKSISIVAVDELKDASQVSSQVSPSVIQYLSPPSMKSARRSTSADNISISSNRSIGSNISANRKRKLGEIGLHGKMKDPDSVSIGGCSLGRGSTDQSLDVDLGNGIMRPRLIKFLSIMYGLFIIVIGAIICVNDLKNPTNDADHLFIVITTLIGMAWIGFLHWDIKKYKAYALEFLKPEALPPKETFSNKSMASEDYDSISISTAVIFNTYRKPVAENIDRASTMSPFESAYRFLHGKHSGNFYLKCGIIVFCFGSIIHQGVNLAQQIHFFVDGNVECRNVITLMVFLIRCLFSFYQLFIVFKYSNILINRHKTLARFALMHLVATSISFWFSTIIEEAIEDYVTKIEASMSSNQTTVANSVLFQKTVSHHMFCSKKALVSSNSIEALPYLYPFTIEYNIILASIWYIIWTNIGKDDVNAFGHHMRREITQNQYGEDEIHYKSAVSINADCHASNRGLFGGLSTLLLILITVIIFFTTIKNKEYNLVGVVIYTVQIGSLTLMSFVVIPLAYKQIRRLDVVHPHHCDNANTAMDDLLVLMPLPFYFLHYVLSIKAEVQLHTGINSYFLIIIYVLTIVQVTIQSPFIVDAIRRCSNSKKHRFKKPGRELVTFALILNVTLWILNTFELKSVDKYHSEQDYYGKFNWMIISHTTLPLMLFYRFHSSVCLSDIWKYAYEKDEHE